VATAELEQRVLECANKAAGTALTLRAGEDIALEAFHFDSLSLFAFMIELENACAIEFDDSLTHQEHLRSVRSTADFIASRRRTASTPEEPE
jgi:acyl carrier protein